MHLFVTFAILFLTPGWLADQSHSAGRSVGQLGNAFQTQLVQCFFQGLPGDRNERAPGPGAYEVHEKFGAQNQILRRHKRDPTRGSWPYY